MFYAGKLKKTPKLSPTSFDIISDGFTKRGLGEREVRGATI